MKKDITLNFPKDSAFSYYYIKFKYINIKIINIFKKIVPITEIFEEGDEWLFFMIIRHIYGLSFWRKKKFFCQKDVVRWGDRTLCVGKRICSLRWEFGC